VFLILSPVSGSNLSVVLSVVPCGEYLEDEVLLALVLKLCSKIKATAMSETMSGSGNVSFLNTRNTEADIFHLSG
jgi:hypothetical protein